MSTQRSESLINEYKGNLFEYLVAQKVAQIFNFEKKFLANLDQSLKNNLVTYQEELRSLDQGLFDELPKLAHETALKLKEYLHFEHLEVELIGKLGAHPQAHYSEADLLVKNNDSMLPISLKLSKKGTATHTKSAGLKSFFIKYFNEEFRQESFNQFLGMCFNKMAINLHELEDMEYLDSFNAWREQGYTEYPGELNESQKEILGRCYSELINRVYDELIDLLKKNKSQVVEGIRSLMGFESQNIVQVKCMYVHNESRYQYYNTEIYKPTQNKDYDLKLEKPKKNQASFEVHLDDKKVQLRIKPMNKFTVPGYKLNCAILS